MPDEIADGLSEEEFEDGMFVFSTEETGGMGVDPGDTVGGEITGIETRTVEFGDDEAVYLEFTIQIDDAFEITEGFPLGEGERALGTKIGAVTERFLDDPDDHDGEVIDPNDVFVGERISFEVDEDDEGFTEVALDVEGIPTIRPEGADLESEVDFNYEGGEDGSDDDADPIPSSDGDSADLGEVLSDMEGESEKEIKTTLAQNHGDLIGEFSEAVDEGDVEFDDDGNLATVDL